MKPFLLFLLLFFPLLAKEKWDLTLCAIFQNEAPFLREWIEYHTLIGFQHFTLYNHFSTDNFQEVLAPYIADGTVELIQWEEKGHPRGQLLAYADAIKKHRGLSRWVAFLDIDEFLVPVQTDNIVEFLEDYEEFAGVAINWQNFGTSYLDSLPEGGLTIELLTWKMPTAYHDAKLLSNHYVKSIVKPNRVNSESKSSHVFIPKKKYLIVDPRKIPIPNGRPLNTDVPIDDIQINHYWFRTTDWFLSTKIKRRTDLGESFPPDKINRLIELGNTVEDLRIQRFVPTLRARLFP